MEARLSELIWNARFHYLFYSLSHVDRINRSLLHRGILFDELIRAKIPGTRLKR